MTGRLVITCDGSSLGNPGPGGWAWVVSADCWRAGGQPWTTNNLMELRAIYEALLVAPPSRPVLIQTDSSYSISVFTEWLAGWKQRGWRTSDKKPVANQRPIQMIEQLLVGRDVTWAHVRGHAGHVENELADRHARDAATAVKEGRDVQTGPGNARCLGRAP